MTRKHCGRRRNCSLRAISPFSAVFSKDLYCRHVKTRACLGNVKVSLQCSLPNKTSHNKQSSNKRLNHEKDWFPVLQKIYRTKNVSNQQSLRGVGRLTNTDIFFRCIKHHSLSLSLSPMSKIGNCLVYLML